MRGGRGGGGGMLLLLLGSEHRTIETVYACDSAKITDISSDSKRKNGERCAPSRPALARPTPTLAPFACAGGSGNTCCLRCPRAYPLKNYKICVPPSISASPRFSAKHQSTCTANLRYAPVISSGSGLDATCPACVSWFLPERTHYLAT